MAPVVMELADFPGGDRPLELRHERHGDYPGDEPGYPDYEFEIEEPLARQLFDDDWNGRWATRIRRKSDGTYRGRMGAEKGEKRAARATSLYLWVRYLPAKLRRACDKDCERKKPGAARKRKRAETCRCPMQLYVTLHTRSGRKSEEAYSRICAWVKDQQDGPRFTREEWLRRRGAQRVVVHHSRPTVEHDAEGAEARVKDDSLFEGLVPCTPAEHDEFHAGEA